MYKRVKRFLIGRPLKNEAMGHEAMGVLWGLPILASDAVSSVAYAGQEILTVLLPIVGVLAFRQLGFISAAIIALLMILVLSYRQTITCYPNGGGAYMVAKENLGVMAGVTAGAALAVDYILTVAVSISSGMDQIVTAFPGIRDVKVEIAVLLVLLILIGNLRGLRESSRVFGIPPYLFMLGMLYLIIAGGLKLYGGYVPPEPTVRSLGEPITLILLLKAFSSGCAALTGVEAVSNAVPSFKAPSVKRAKVVLTLLAVIILVLFGGSSIMANMYHIVPDEHHALLILLTEQVFGRGFMYYYITATTFIILIMASNTAFTGFPMLLSVIAKDGYAPRQLSMRGDRLSYSNGILALSGVAIALVVAFQADVSKLIGLYAIGVFISFTLSQSGMFMRWLRNKGEHWQFKAAVNGFGAIVTACVVCIIAVVKFEEGAWLVVLLIPMLVYVMLKVKRHYCAVAMQLRLSEDELCDVDTKHQAYRNRVIVPIASINKASVRALRYARTISDHVVAFNVSLDESAAEKMRERYALLNTDIPLVVKYSPFRKVVEPLFKFIESAEYEYQKGDMITVILPQFAVSSWWHKLLHNHSRLFIERELIRHKHIVVATMPLQLKSDDYVIRSGKFGSIKDFQ